MWRVLADVEMQDNYNLRLFKTRFNPMDDMRDTEFQERYRFPKDLVTQLIDLLEPALVRNTHRSQSLDPSLQVCVALRYFAQGGYLPVIADIHGISERSASKCIHTVANAICDRIDHFISWPGPEEFQQTKIKFYEKTNGFPCIVGLVDGRQVPIWGPHPPANEAAFVNRKGVHSINCQILCDADMKIYSLDAHWPGSSHDSHVLRYSEVHEKFEAGLMPNSWLLGDSGYALSNWLLTPYANVRNNAEERYNAAHKRARSGVERCIGVWKMRWRCLTKPIMYQPVRASKIIASCGDLHNFAVEHRIELEENIDVELINQYQPPNPFAVQQDNNRVTVRDQLVRRVFNLE